jgi:tetrahydromethanopterin S-methyltransferase subunit G
MSTIAAFDSYADAQRAVDRLSDQGFPVEKVTIVGRGLRYVEKVMGRLTTGRAALLGAAQGAAIGALFGLLVGLIFTTDPGVSTFLFIVYGLVTGAIMGAILGAVTHAATGGERDFASAAGMEADRYEVTVDDDVADRAAELLR